MTTRLYVDVRGGWYQMMERPLGSSEVRRRMEDLAAAALSQFVHMDTVRVTAMEDGFVITMDRDRTGPPKQKTCPHCGGFL
jgi:hypothetical protein